MFSCLLECSQYLRLDGHRGSSSSRSQNPQLLYFCVLLLSKFLKNPGGSSFLAFTLFFSRLLLDPLFTEFDFNVKIRTFYLLRLIRRRTRVALPQQLLGSHHDSYSTGQSGRGPRTRCAVLEEEYLPAS